MSEPRNFEYENSQALKHEISGLVDYATHVKYKWISESGKNTCEKCKSLDGKVFDIKDLPKRPHPNCRCRIEEISVVEGQVSKLYGYRDEKFNMEIDAKEILGDLSVIRKKIYLDTDYIIKLIENNKNFFAISNENQKIYLEIIEKKEKTLGEIESLEIEINRYIDNLARLNKNSDEEFFQQKLFELIQLSSRRKELYDQSEYLRLRALQLKWDVVIVFSEEGLSSKDAGAIWKLASSKFTDKDGLEYIKHNGYIVNKINDLQNRELEKLIEKN